MNSTYIDFSVAIEKYFGQYLVAERGASSHTIRSYRDNFLIFIRYFEEFIEITDLKKRMFYSRKSKKRKNIRF